MLQPENVAQARLERTNKIINPHKGIIILNREDVLKDEPCLKKITASELTIKGFKN
jgi:hypothetical protein